MSEIICYNSDGRVLDKLTQWDVGQAIVVHGVNSQFIPMFHFCNNRSYRALVVQPERIDGDLVAKVPNILLQEARTINVYLYYQTNKDEAKTEYSISIPVEPRKKPFDYEYTENIGYTNWIEINKEAKAVIENLNAVNSQSSEMLTKVDAVIVELNNAISEANSFAGKANNAAEDAYQAASMAIEAGELAKNVVDSIIPEVSSLRDDVNALLSSRTINLVPIDSVILVEKQDDGDTCIGIKLSNAEGNILSVMDDGLYATADAISIENVDGLGNRLQDIEESISLQDF